MLWVWYQSWFRCGNGSIAPAITLSTVVKTPLSGFSGKLSFQSLFERFSNRSIALWLTLPIDFGLAQVNRAKSGLNSAQLMQLYPL